jgi:hypothetical protein
MTDRCHVELTTSGPTGSCIVLASLADMTTGFDGSSQTAPTERERFHFFRDGLILGLLTALGPLAIDMYLPSLPVIGAAMSVDANVVLDSLTVYLVAFALGQLGSARSLTCSAGRHPCRSAS